MTVDGSYAAWVRPTRRVHLALSVGMTLTGVILIAAGASGGRGAVRPAPMIGRTADSVVSGGVAGAGIPGILVPAAPLVHFAPPVAGMPAIGTPVIGTPAIGRPAAGTPAAGATKPEAKPHAKLKPHHRHRPHPSDVSQP
ncbi:hypothetical protein ABIA31_007678 [Catenulispora sp. MAP5-51]|uniref:hypothetical protein n=1 Tax=Catenulispora sp. MAP5-51 TaxID=3156298 RepID=UPI003515C1E3